jgi:broad specificity phosphatase PhoE
MHRVSSILIDVEQEVVPTLVVSHVSILQCLMAYFRNTRVEKCMSIEVPLHTVIKFTPVRGGGWSESHHPFYGVETEEETKSGGTPEVDSTGDLNEYPGTPPYAKSCTSLPIWGDSIMVSPRYTRPALIKRITR